MNGSKENPLDVATVSQMVVNGKEASEGGESKSPLPGRSAPKGGAAKRGPGQKPITTFVSVSPHKKGEPKPDVPKPVRCYQRSRKSWNT